MTGEEPLITQLEIDLAAYTPFELECYVDTVNTLLQEADNGTHEYSLTSHRIRRVMAESLYNLGKAGIASEQTAQIIPFPPKA
jgi:hypothetical protein